MFAFLANALSRMFSLQTEQYNFVRISDIPVKRTRTDFFVVKFRFDGISDSSSSKTQIIIPYNAAIENSAYIANQQKNVLCNSFLISLF